MKQKARRFEPMAKPCAFFGACKCGLKMFYAVRGLLASRGRINILSVGRLPVSQNKAKMFNKVYALPLRNEAL